MSPGRSGGKAVIGLTGKTVLIVGGTGQIGLPIAEACARAQATVLVTSTSLVRATKAAHDIAERVPGALVHGCTLDAGSEEAIRAFVRDLRDSGHRPDALVYCARNVAFLGGGKDSPRREDWISEYGLDVVGACQLSMELAPELGAGGSGAIVLVSSIYGTVAVNPGMYTDPSWMPPIHYSTAKAATEALARELAVRLAPKGIRVNCVSYGGVRGRMDAEFESRYASRCPSGRMLEAADLGGPVVFLLSDAASGVVGHNLVVDGGWTAW